MVSLQYLAGFIDGEGSISLLRRYDKRSRYTYRPILQITQKENYNKDVIKMFQWLKNRYGGHFGKFLRNDTFNKKDVEYYSYKVEYQKMYVLLKDIYRYLIIKKEQAKLTLQWLELLRGKHWGCVGKPKKIREREDQIFFKMNKIQNKNRKQGGEDG